MRRSSLLLLFFLTWSGISAQYLEVGVHTGMSNYLGELSEQRISSEEFNTMLGIFGRYNATKYLSLKGSLIKGTITGNDANARIAENRERNLNFRSEILEFSLTSEVNLTPYNIRDNKTGVPYFFSGIAFTHFNPEAQMRGSWYYLQPYRTEGHKYSKYTVAVPFGLGMKFNLTYKINFGLEIGARKTFTDYLDDVSTRYTDVLALRQDDPTAAALAYRTPEITGEFGENPIGLERGNAGNDDWYFFAGITVSVNMTDKYGLDFDPKYDAFKEHLKKPENLKKIRRQEVRKKRKAYLKQRRKAKRSKRKLEPQAKKRTH